MVKNRRLIYITQQDFLANELQMQFEKLSNQARFVQMIIDKQLSVSNRKKADIIADLRKLEFRPFPKVRKAKAAGETEEVVNQDEEADDDASTGSTDYDYLLGMAIWSLTKEKVSGTVKDAPLFLTRTSRSKDFANKLRIRKPSCSPCSNALLTHCGTKTLTIS